MTEQPQNGPSMGSLTPEERDELNKLRAERAARDEQAAKAEADAKANEPAPAFWLHLANGEVIESTGVMTHYKNIPVIGAYPITEMEGAES